MKNIREIPETSDKLIAAWFYAKSCESQDLADVNPEAALTMSAQLIHFARTSGYFDKDHC